MLLTCRLDASAWPSAPTRCNLPGSSPPVQPEGDLCAQYCREGTCSKGASCERLHGIYCKVLVLSNLPMSTHDIV